ncbi:MAG TPA: methyltransferase domain-containing protein [Isosphaeraceae bacterium]
MPSSAFAGLAERDRRPEVMDDPALDPTEHARALHGLGRINALSRSASLLWPSIAIMASSNGGTIRVLDIASGGGDVPIGLARKAEASGLPVDIEGSDASPEAVRFATARARGRVPFRVLDALREPIPEGFDVLTCSLFLHHLDRAEACHLLAKMATARLVLVNDLDRTRAGYLLAWAGCRVLSRSPVVHHDGPVSVAAAFTPDEALALARESGLVGATVTRRWPERFLLAWSRP